MDPLSAIGVLGTLFNLIEGAHALLRVARAIKEGERDIVELCNDVAFFEEALKGFDRILRKPQMTHNISPVIISKSLQESTLTIQVLHEKLLSVTKFETSSIRRMKWLQSKSAVRKSHERLKAQCNMLQSFLALAHTETFLNACHHYPEIPLLVTQDASCANSDCSETSSLASRTSLNSSSNFSTDTACSSLQSASSSIQLDLSDVSTKASKSVDETHPIGPSTVRKACRFDCYCVCHPRAHLENGTMSSIKNSLLQLGMSSPPCDDPRCQSKNALESTIDFTSKIFQKTFPHVMSSHTLKVRYHLSTFHVVFEGSDVMRYTRQGNLDSLRSAIQSGQATIWDTAPDGWSLLHTAVYNRQLPTVKYLLELGADTEVADVGARRPADLAVLNSLTTGATHIEQEIFNHFSQKNDYISDFDFTPVHRAVLEIYDPDDFERPSLGQVLDLLDDCNNAPPGTNWTKWKGQFKRRSPLLSAIIEYFRATAYELPKNSKIIHNIIDQKDKSICWTPLHWACSTDKREKIATLIYHGADPFTLSNLGFNILHSAAESKGLGGLGDALDIWRNYPERLHINQRNHWGETPLHVAAWGSVQNVKLLVEAGADRAARQEDGQIPLHFTGMTATGNARQQIIDLLCMGQSTTCINDQDNDGRSPLFEFLDSAECVEILIKYGARLDVLDSSGRSVFHHACMQDHNRTLETLLRLCPPESVIPMIKDHDGNTALNLALKNESKACALSLLKMPDVGDMVGQDGWTAVHHAANLGDDEVLQAVLKHGGFRQGLKTIDGKTAEVVAMEAGNWCGQIREMLRRAKA